MPLRTISDLWRTLQLFFRTEGGFEGKEITTPSNPSSGYERIYPKSDGYWYRLKSDGTETTFSLSDHTHTVSTLKKIYTQASHGFAAGDVIKRSSGSYAKAQADTAANAEAVGIVESVDGNDFVLVMSGQITLSGLTDAAVYFLSAATAGAYTSTDPAIADPTLVSKPVFVATSTTTAIVVNMRGIIVGDPAPLGDVVGGRLNYVSATQVAWTFDKNNQIREHNGTDWEVVELASAPTLANSANDMGGDALTYSLNYDVFLKYSDATTATFECAKWATNTARYAAWATTTAYKIGQRVSNSGSYYACLEAHTSGTFATDLAAGKWVLLEGTGNLLGLGVCDGTPVYANSGDWRKYRYVGIARLVNSSGAKFQSGLVASYYNWLPKAIQCYNSTSSWTYNSSTVRESYNGSGAVKGEFLLCCAIEPLIGIKQNVYNDSGMIAEVGLAIDSTTSATLTAKSYVSASYGSATAVGKASVGIGYHYITVVESTNAAGGNVTFYGTTAHNLGIIEVMQ